MTDSMKNNTDYAQQFEFMLKAGQINANGDMIQPLNKRPKYWNLLRNATDMYYDIDQLETNESLIQLINSVTNIAIYAKCMAIQYKHKRNIFRLEKRLEKGMHWLYLVRDGMDFYAAIDAMMQYNIASILRDELGHVVIDNRRLLSDGSKNLQFGMPMKNDMPKPDLSKFIGNI